MFLAGLAYYNLQKATLSLIFYHSLFNFPPTSSPSICYMYICATFLFFASIWPCSFQLLSAGDKEISFFSFPHFKVFSLDILSPSSRGSTGI